MIVYFTGKAHWATKWKVIVLKKRKVSDDKVIVYFCLQVIFLDNFMKKIYNFINGVEMLHLYGTYEQESENAANF